MTYMCTQFPPQILVFVLATGIVHGSGRAELALTGFANDCVVLDSVVLFTINTTVKHLVACVVYSI